MSVTFAKGFQAAGVNAGISAHPDRPDLAIVVNTGSQIAAAGVFTANRFCASAVQWSRRALADGQIRAVVLNSGGANACTGEPGYEQTQAMARTLAHQLEDTPENIAVCSTGLIGELLPIDRVLQGIDKACCVRSGTEQAGTDAAQAIMTTDTEPKMASAQGQGYRIGGMVKGSGMIAPQLATMLCVITTDALVDAQQLQQALSHAVEYSFNRIDVDGCMSTNDTVLLLSSGASGIHPDMAEFGEKLDDVCMQLAKQIIADGEGMSHEVEIRVIGASTQQAALACARAVASSNLLKCAIYGNDPNWGRVVSSLGTVPESVAPYDPREVSVDINGVRVCESGQPACERHSVDMTGRQVCIVIDLHHGNECASVLTDDLTYEYVHINAEYES